MADQRAMTDAKVDAFASRLGEANLELKLKLQVATDLRDSVEYLTQGPSYATFLEKLMPIFMRILQGEPVFISTSLEQRLRMCVLEILHRLPMTPPETLEPYAPDLADLLMNLVRKENEENAVQCMKTIMDLQRHQTKVLAEKAQPFLDLIQEMFRGMGQAVHDTFDTVQGAQAQVPSTPSNSSNFQSPRPGSPMATADLGLDQQASRPLAKGMQSFKVLAECPIIVVSLFQAHKPLMGPNVKQFVPLIKSVLLLQAKPQERAHAEAKAQKRIFYGVAPQTKNRAAFGEFVTAQVKTMSFLAYLLRISAQFNDFTQSLPEIVVRLLQDIPRERSAARKELLVAIRHIINFNVRRSFTEKIDELLDERTLIGDGLTVYETMRPLAYSMLADLIHHVRDLLDRHQIRRTINVYTKNLHDNFPGTSFQTMSAKLLLNMADCIAKLEDKNEARHFLIMILDAIGDKFAAMNRQYDNAVKLSKQFAEKSPETSPGHFLAEKDAPPDWDEIDIFNASPIKVSNLRDRASDPVADNRFLLRNLVNGLKSVFYCLKECNPQPDPIRSENTPANWGDVSYGYNAEEVKVITKLFREGAHVFRYYGTDKAPPENSKVSPLELFANHYTVTSGPEEKELLEVFATVFHCIDPATFQEIFHSEIPRLYDMMFEHTGLLLVPQFFLASEASSPSFAGMLLRFLMDRIHQVGSSDSKLSCILLRLFKLSFMAVTLFSSQNEHVLLPHVTAIVTKSIELSRTAEEPINYFLLLRSLFRSIGGGRFESLYKEILPLLEMLLETLNNLISSARKPQERDLYVEVCLTVPARLSNLLPHLSYLMTPLVVALKAGPELVSQGLRTLELCVDNLTADYLDPIMSPIMQDLMVALWGHLKPAPYSHFHSHTTMRILGKLGGRNRKFLNSPPNLNFQSYTDDEASFGIKLVGSSKERAFPTSIGLEHALNTLISPPKTLSGKDSAGFYRAQAFHLLSSHLKLCIGWDSLPEDLSQIVRLQARDILELSYQGASDVMEKSDRTKSTTKKEAQEAVLKRLLVACIHACSFSDLSDQAMLLMENVCRHFVIIEIGRSLAQAKHSRRPFDVCAGEGPFHLDCRILAEAIVESFASEQAEVREVAETMILKIREAVVTIVGSTDRIERMPIFSYLGRTFCHSCHEENWFTKAGGSQGIHVLITKADLGDAWIAEKQLEFARSLIHVIKDVPEDISASTRLNASKTLETLLRRCNSGMSESELTSHNSKLSSLCGFLVYELAHMNKHVREASQNAFHTLAEAMGIEIHKLLDPVKERLLSPIFNKPLRALPFPTQIGYIDAVTFCLSLHNEVIDFQDGMNRLLTECAALADADDESFSNKSVDHRTSESIVRLRVSCLRLLSMALNYPEFGNSPQADGRSKIIGCFFKSLYSKSTEVIDAATDGLRGILSQTNKLSKVVLQEGLRPILMNLQEPKRLSVAGLDGLARLLTLLTNYFKPEIGTRLMDHMKTFTDPNTLQRISFTVVEQNSQMKIVAAILNVYHLLPPAAIMFLEPLVQKVMEFEESLRRTRYSPFREPLIKYLNRYSTESWQFFSAKLTNIKLGRFFAQILSDEESGRLREAVLADPEKLLNNSLQVEDPNARLVGILSGIHIIHALTTFIGNATWLATQTELLQTLIASGKELSGYSLHDSSSSRLTLAVKQAGEQLMEIITVYLATAPGNLEFLFEVINAVMSDELRPDDRLIHHIYTHIICSESVEFWRNVITKCLEFSSGRGGSQQSRTFIFHYLVNPIFAMDVMRTAKSGNSPSGPRLMDKNMTETIHQKIWKSHLGDTGEENSQPGVDHTRMELLQLSAMLIKYHHHFIIDVRKDIIKFGWTFIRLEDVINKHAAYVVIAYFIHHYDTPSRIVIQIYVALLRASQNEVKSLVTQALELMADVLPKRVGGGSGDTRSILWAKWPKKILMEESGNLQQLISIFNFIVRHTALFYESRDQFIPVMVQSLSKIAPLHQPPHPSSENKKLALSLIGLIYEWEERRIYGPSDSPLTNGMSDSPHSRKRKSDSLQRDQIGTPTRTNGVATDGSEYRIPSQLRMVVLKYLLQFISTLTERFTTGPSPAQGTKTTPSHSHSQASQPAIIQKALKYFRSFLRLGFWDDLQMDPISDAIRDILTGEKFDAADEKHITTILNTLYAVRIMIDTKSDEWIANHLIQLQSLLEKPIRSENAAIQECLHSSALDTDTTIASRPIVKRILSAIPEPTHEDEDVDMDAPNHEFVTFLSVAASDLLSNASYVSSINILVSLSERMPEEIDQHLPQLTKALSQKIARDHVNSQSAVGNTANAQNSGSVNQKDISAEHQDVEIQTDVVLKTIDIISTRMPALGDQRRPFLSVLASLVEKSQSTALCNRVLEMAEYWIFESQDSYPTLKEKTAVLHKMVMFESRSDPAFLNKFLDLVIRIYEDPQITRTELTVRLEHAFLIGTRAQNVDMRNRFMKIFDRSVTRTSSARLKYILCSQNWDTLADSFWLAQAGQLTLGSVEMNAAVQLHADDFKVWPISVLSGSYANDSRKADVMLDEKYEDLISRHRRFCSELGEIKAKDLLEPLYHLQYLDANVAREVWIHLFPLCWSSLSREDRTELERGVVNLLTKDYHQRQIDQRPNVVQTLLEGVARARPTFKVPPHVLKFLSRTYDAWYTAACTLEDATITPVIDTPSVRESNMDALVEIYASLQEDDLFYGTWRRKCQFVESNAALSYEQHGMWDKSQHLFEAAQIKARTGSIPLSQGEYMIWEDHWLNCAQKLQQWELLHEFAKHENLSDLQLESGWRQLDLLGNQGERDYFESVIKGVMDAPTPRRHFFQAFMSLLKLHNKTENIQDFTRACDESIQLSIRKWHQLPERITNAHIPILQNFQQLVELHDASVISASLAQTNRQNLDSKSHELKLLLGTWRDRLPNLWDDINAWQDLVTWRQHIFKMINNTYLNLVPQGGSNAGGNSFAYRGFHETAWIINRFAHVARKHQLPEVCFNYLSQIYTLPNIEIQEAFLKLREQAKCHYQNPSELNSGLDVINNTNLNYFAKQQQSEFFTLKGMFLAKLERKDEATEAFGMALHFEAKLAKAWAEWGHYEDNNFREDPSDITKASRAVHCYLEASAFFKSARSRKLISRILWLLSLDDEERTIAKTFDAFKEEMPLWYWITFIPQMLSSLSHGEAPQCARILDQIAKAYPQALYFMLRTSREDLNSMKKQHEAKIEKAGRVGQASSPGKQGSPQIAQSTPKSRPDGPEKQHSSSAEPQQNGVPREQGAGSPKQSSSGRKQSMSTDTPNQVKEEPKENREMYPWEYAEGIMSTLKTNFPLLALSMETMVDQIQKHFKCPPDEDAYRLIVALLNDGLSYVGRMPASYAQDQKLPPATEANITRFAETILPAHIRKSFEADFVTRKPTMHEYIQKLRRWRDKFEEKLDRRTPYQYLEHFSPHLNEFRFQKFDEVEVPGQYLLHRDKNQDFVRIEKFLPKVDLVRGIGVCHRRLKIRGHDGSIHPFAIQHPAARHCRREERILQLFRIFNSVLLKRKESRRRNLFFHLPVMVPLAPHIRMVQDDASYISLQGVYEDHCRRNGMNKDEPVLFTMEKLRALTEMKPQKSPEQTLNLRMETFTAIQEKWVPSDIALRFFQKTYPSFDDFWLFRRQFSYQLAALTFMTYVMHVNNRYPHKLSISRATGNIWGSELLPALASGRPVLHNPEHVPFRLTPNLQTLLGPIAMEGILSSAIMAIARCLTQPEFELEANLSIFIRDEMLLWFTQQHRNVNKEKQLRDTVQLNSNVIVKKAVSLARPPEGILPANQTVIDLIARAVNPSNLAQSEALWMPYL